MAYQSKLESESTDMLFDAVLALESREDCYRFFEDLCTVSELLAMSQRIEVAYMLSKNVTYHEIAEKPAQARRRSAASIAVCTTGRTAIVRC